MPPRNLNIILIAFCLSTLCYFTHRRARTAMVVGDALELINNYYVDPVDDRKLLIAALKGMTSTLDEHSEFIPIDDYESFQDSISQEFAGIGIYVEQPDPSQPVRVVTPLVDSPALKAGMNPGDLIIRVDDADVSQMQLSDVSSRLKGPIDTVVHLVVLRGDEEVALSVTRATIPLPSVIGDHRDTEDEWVFRLQDDPTIAYVRLTSFGEKTVDELAVVLTKLDNDFRGLVLDLRGNGGGLLHAAVEVSDMFLNGGQIVSTRIRGGEMEDEFSAESGTLIDSGKPVAILINNNSASASEIVAACLQDNGRAGIVGARSYGKGTVQNILPLEYGRSALRLTVARYYRPNGQNIHRAKDAPEEDEWGVKPDDGMSVDIDEQTFERLAKRWREASYPAMAGQPTSPAGDEADDPKPDDSDDRDTDPADTKTPPEVDPAPENEAPGTPAPTNGAESGSGSALELDPQLKRAVEYLRQQLDAKPTAEAA